MQKFINLKENDIPINDVFTNTKHLLDAINKNILTKRREDSSKDNNNLENENEYENEFDENKAKKSNILFSNGIKMIINEVNKDIEECYIKQLKYVLFFS